jgi:hypothetical protein
VVALLAPENVVLQDGHYIVWTESVRRDDVADGLKRPFVSPNLVLDKGRYRQHPNRLLFDRIQSFGAQEA